MNQWERLKKPKRKQLRSRLKPEFVQPKAKKRTEMRFAFLALCEYLRAYNPLQKSGPRVIVFIVGGITHSEIRSVYQLEKR